MSLSLAPISYYLRRWKKYSPWLIIVQFQHIPLISGPKNVDRLLQNMRFSLNLALILAMTIYCSKYLQFSIFHKFFLFFSLAAFSMLSVWEKNSSSVLNSFIFLWTTLKSSISILKFFPSQFLMDFIINFLSDVDNDSEYFLWVRKPERKRSSQKFIKYRQKGKRKKIWNVIYKQYLCDKIFFIEGSALKTWYQK